MSVGKCTITYESKCTHVYIELRVCVDSRVEGDGYIDISIDLEKWRIGRRHEALHEQTGTPTGTIRINTPIRYE